MKQSKSDCRGETRIATCQLTTYAVRDEPNADCRISVTSVTSVVKVAALLSR